ncbi:MAG TPA: hypothetical protein VNB90_13235 [Cytophagaceae bacterium]|nr:hypothetical protein [Cytophagaceae bacterium]
MATGFTTALVTGFAVSLTGFTGCLVGFVEVLAAGTGLVLMATGFATAFFEIGVLTVLDLDTGAFLGAALEAIGFLEAGFEAEVGFPFEAVFLVAVPFLSAFLEDGAGFAVAFFATIFFLESFLAIKY